MKKLSVLFLIVAATIDGGRANALVPSFSGFMPDVRSGGKYASDYTEYVHVIIDNSDKTATFLYCATDQIKDCKTLGNHAKYKLRDLQLRQKKLRHDGRMMIAADAGVLVGAALAGTITTLAMPTPVGPGVLLLYAASGAAGASVFIVKNYFIPGADTGVKRLKDATLLEKSMLAGQDVRVDEPINEFAERLDAALKTMI